MFSPVLEDPRIYRFLCVVDSDLAAAVQSAGCVQCGSTLHSARYPRRIQGVAMQPVSTHNYRDSFCCAREGCRRRVTPPSVRFLGRKRYLSAVVLLVSAARYGARATLVQALQHTYGISRSTLARWQRWWRETVPQTSFWMAARERLMPPIDPGRIPAELVRRFEATAATDKLLAVLRFIATLPDDLRVTNIHDIQGSSGVRRV